MSLYLDGKGGQILEADFAQLEFRVAAYLSQDEVAMQEIVTGFDVHPTQLKLLRMQGKPTTRQVGEGSSHLLPFSGLVGWGRSKAEAAYYKHFNEKYQGIAKWHKKLGDEAIRYTQDNYTIRAPVCISLMLSVGRTEQPTHFTMIKNYPVQGLCYW